MLCIPHYLAVALRTGVAAATEHDAILYGLELDTIVDIGANRGQFALCARRLYPLSQIYSFEPLQRPAEKHRKVFENDRHTKLFNLAVSETTGSASMHVSQWDVSSSLLPFARAQHENYPLTGKLRQESVRTTILADCLNEEKIQGKALLKIDVQGFEIAVLRGCATLLDKFDYIYVEASFVQLYVGQPLADDVIQYLSSKGYFLICVANLSYGLSKRPIQADFLFSRQKLKQ